MTQFNYALDESQIRAALLKLSVIPKPEQWLFFERFADSRVQEKQKKGLRAIHLPNTRQVVLPLVFAGVVILFSLLLVNFISIKNSARVKATIIEPVHISMPTIAEPFPVAPLPQKATAIVKPNTDAVRQPEIVPVAQNAAESTEKLRLEPRETSVTVQQPSSEASIISSIRPGTVADDGTDALPE